MQIQIKAKHDTAKRYNIKKRENRISQVPCEIVPRTAAAFPRWMATATLCMRYWWAKGSWVTEKMRWEISLNKVHASQPKTPSVSTATGMKWWEEFRWEYSSFFLCSASAATAPASTEATGEWDGASLFIYLFIYLLLFWVVLCCIVSRPLSCLY